MSTSGYGGFLLALLSAVILVSCAGGPPERAHRNLKLEEVQRPLGEAPTYLYRDEPASR